MLQQEMIRKTEAFLRQMYDRGAYLRSHPAEKDYRLAHSFRVAEIGRRIAQGEGFDETELTVACLLHDLAYCETFGEDGWREHGRRSARLARSFLQELGIAPDRVHEICYGIAIHVDDAADFPGERTPFALSVGDADNIDRMDVYRIHETLCADGFLEQSLPAQLEYVGRKLSGLREMAQLPIATETAAAMWKERISFRTAFFERLSAQLEQSRGSFRTD